MITKYKSLNIFKREPTDDPKKPTHDITAIVQNPDGTYGKSINVGSAWTRDGQKGKFLSVGLSKSREWEGKKFIGYVLVSEEELDSLILKVEKPGYPVPGIDDYKPEDIDF